MTCLTELTHSPPQPRELRSLQATGKKKKAIRHREVREGLTFLAPGVRQREPEREDDWKENKVSDLFPESLLRKSHVQRFRLNLVVRVLSSGSSASPGYTHLLLGCSEQNMLVSEAMSPRLPGYPTPGIAIKIGTA